MLQSLSGFAFSTLTTGVFTFKKNANQTFFGSQFEDWFRKVNGNGSYSTKYPLIRIQICTLACF